MTYIRIQTKVAQKKESIKLLGPSRYEISVKAKPERNEANARVVEMLAAQLRIPKKFIRFVSGHTSRSKLFEVRT